MFLFHLEGIILLEKQCILLSLFHAINEGMDMGIVNPSMLEVYDEFQKIFRTGRGCFIE